MPLRKAGADGDGTCRRTAWTTVVWNSNAQQFRDAVCAPLSAIDMNANMKQLHQPNSVILSPCLQKPGEKPRIAV